MESVLNNVVKYIVNSFRPTTVSYRKNTIGIVIQKIQKLHKTFVFIKLNCSKMPILSVASSAKTWILPLSMASSKIKSLQRP